MRILIVGLGGGALALWFARTARRYTVVDRLRTERSRSIRLPLPLRLRIEHALDAAALDVAVDRALSTWLWSMVVAGAVGLGFGGPAVGFGGAVVVGIGVPVGVATLHERRGRLIAAAVPDSLERVASELRSGGTIVTAIAAVAAGEGPLAPDMARIDTRLRLGASITDALGAWSAERTVSGVGATAGALALCSAVGGRSADALDGLATSLRDRLAVTAEAHALSSQARMSAVVVGGAPVAYIAWSAMVDPHALHVLTGTLFGRVCLVFGLGLEALGGWWMRRIVRAGSAC